MEYLINRLREPSTAAGGAALAQLLQLFGVPPEVGHAITAVLAAVAVLLPEQKK